MENKLQIFQNEELGSLRTVEIDGEIYFVGKDVAKILNYKNPQEAIRTHVDAEDKGVREILTPGGVQQMTVINESGLYSLILSSKLPTAKKFKRWVTSEVLPSIRKTGGYKAENIWTDKEKAEMLKEYAALATDDTLRYSILKEATEFVTGRPLKILPQKPQKNFYDRNSLEKFLNDWLAKNFFHIAERNGALPPLEPERGFYHKGKLCVYPVEEFLKDAEEEGFTNADELLDSLLKNSLLIPEKAGEGKHRRKKCFRRNGGWIYGLMLDDI